MKMDPSELKVLQDLARQNERLANQVTALVGTMKDIKNSLAEKPGSARGGGSSKAQDLASRQAAAERVKSALASGRMPDSNDLESMLADQYSRTVDVRPGVSGLFESLGRSQFPSREQTIARAAYGTPFLGGGSRLDKFRFAGALLSTAYASRWRPPDAPPYDPDTGERIPYSSGKYNELSPKQQEELLRSEEFGKNLAAIDPTTLSEEDQILYRKATGELTYSGKARKRPLSEKGKRDAQLRFGGSFAEQLFDKGKSLSGYAAEAPGAVGALSSSGRMFGALAGIGEGAMAASEFLAGPVAAAYEAGKVAYGFTKGTLYDPARSAAGLGYGFSYNPLSRGAQVSLDRSLQTRIDSLFSMGISGQQTAAARAAVEGMGIGGAGSESMYNEYYSSMRDVIQNTQLSADTLSPFYEQFMRQGGQANEVGKLTKMLAEDLPKAAAASRMSLEQMAQAVSATTDAVAQSPFNVRTRTQISQSIIDAQQAGAPKGMTGIIGGLNPLITAQTATRLGMNYFQAMQQGSQLAITAAETIRSTIGPGVNNTEDFDALMADPQGSMKIMMAQQMTGMTVDDIRKLYSQGIENFIGAQGLETKLSDSLRTGTKKSGIDKSKIDHIEFIKDPETGKVTGRKFVYENKTISEKLKGTDIDLYKDTGAELDKAYQPVIKTLEDSLRAMDPAAEKDFENQLKELRGKPANETFKLLQETARTVQGAAATGAGQITLSDEARKYFKLTFGNDYKDPNPPNAQFNIGAVRQGIGAG